MSPEAATFSIFWLIWLIGFVIVEVFALRNKAEGDTLSELVYRLKRNNVFFGIITVFWLVLTWHFFVG